MKRFPSLLCGLLFSFSVFSQSATSPVFNLGFETVANGFPEGWEGMGASNYSLTLDSSVVRSGKYSACITFKDGSPEFRAWSLIIPGSYAGKKITLTGYIKTENVSDGYAGLWMRIDPSVAFDNMHKRGVKGTTDWTRYEVTLTMDPQKTEQFAVGGLLAGTGKVWIDDLQISIDGKDIQTLHPLEKKWLPADLDKEFDNGSRISISSLSPLQVNHLKLLGQVWGFLKYHHPKIAVGGVNWDYELFRILPGILGAETPEQRDQLLVTWIRNLGPFTKGKPKAIKEAQVKIYPDQAWITQNGFSTELSVLLQDIRYAKRPQEHYYIGFYPGIGNPQFKNEKDYASMAFPDEGFRLLALYRYWNIIRYYFPYKNLIEGDWTNVLETYIPLFVNSASEQEYTLTVLELIGKIHDTHANIWGGGPTLKTYFGDRYAPIDLVFVDGQPVVNGYYNDTLGKASGLLPGDMIVAVDHTPVEQIIVENLKYTPASNYPTQLRDMAVLLVRSNDTTIHLEFMRDGKREQRNVNTCMRRELNLYGKYQSADSSFSLIREDVAYINNSSLKTSHLPQIWDAIQHTKGLIIDLRNYPSDFPLYHLSSYLMPGRLPFVYITDGDNGLPGLFVFKELLYVGKKNPGYYKGKVVILVNEVSQSSSEFHAMAYRQHPRAVVIGSTTAGADGNVSAFDLPGGISTMISGVGIYYPDGTETQCIGIVPDIEVRPTVEGIKNGRDELMEKAIEIIDAP